MDHWTDVRGKNIERRSFQTQKKVTEKEYRLLEVGGNEGFGVENSAVHDKYVSCHNDLERLENRNFLYIKQSKAFYDVSHSLGNPFKIGCGFRCSHPKVGNVRESTRENIKAVYIELHF